MGKREVRCEVCGTLNRVARYYISQIPRCGKAGCGAELPEPSHFKWLRRAARLRGTGHYWLLLALVAFILWAAKDSISMSVGCMLFTPKQPAHGLYARYTEAAGVVPLTLNSTAGQNYFVKFESPQTSRPVITFFVHGGTPMHAMMPIGRVTLKSADGHDWCGESNLFGGSTSIVEADRSIVFWDGEEHTIWLTPSREGNLRLNPIPRSKF